MSFTTPGLLSEAQMRQQQNRDGIGQYAEKPQGAPGAAAHLSHRPGAANRESPDAALQDPSVGAPETACLGDEPCDGTIDLCASHAAESVHAAAARIAAARNGHEATLARHEWEQAMTAYASTPFGETSVKQMLMDVRKEATQAARQDREAVLARVLERGAAVAAARRDALAVDALAALTVPAAPPPPVHLVGFTPDENGNALDPGSRAWFERQVEQHAPLAAEAEADGIRADNYRFGDQEHERRRRAVFIAREVPAADSVIASAAATDADLAEAVNVTSRLVEGLSRDPLDSDAATARDAVRAQLMRALDHPNASSETFEAVAFESRGTVPVDDVVARRACPGEVLAGMDWRSQTESSETGRPWNLTAHRWEELRDQAATSPGHAIFVALHHPQDSAAAEAESHLAGVRWADLSPREIGRTAAFLFGYSDRRRNENSLQVASLAAQALRRDLSQGDAATDAALRSAYRRAADRGFFDPPPARDDDQVVAEPEARKVARRRLFG